MKFITPQSHVDFVSNQSSRVLTLLIWYIFYSKEFSLVSQIPVSNILLQILRDKF